MQLAETNGMLELFQTLDLAFGGKAASQPRADAGGAPEQDLGRQFSSQTIQLRPAPGADHFRDRAGDTHSNGGKRDQSLTAVLQKYLIERRDHNGGPPKSLGTKPALALLHE